jgi:hypothetical protein
MLRIVREVERQGPRVQGSKVSRFRGSIGAPFGTLSVAREAAGLKARYCLRRGAASLAGLPEADGGGAPGEFRGVPFFWFVFLGKQENERL